MVLLEGAVENKKYVKRFFASVQKDRNFGQKRKALMMIYNNNK